MVLARITPLLAAALLVAGCGSSSQEAAPSSEQPDATTAETAGDADAGDDTDAGGQMTVVYEDATSPEAQNGKQLLEDAQILEELAASVNDLLVLPYDIPLKGAQCDDANAFWSPADQAMTICYEYPDMSEFIFTQAGDADPLDSAMNAVVATFYHEMGHMTIDIYELPATGREEDTADQLSAFMLLQPDDDGNLDPDSVQAVVDAAREFDAYSQIGGELDDSAFSDVHSLDATRKFNLLCWVYGADPDGQADLVSSGQLPQDRADGCDVEFAKMDYAWASLLEPHLKDN